MCKRASSRGRKVKVGGVVLMLLMALAMTVQAGDLNSPGAPTDAASEMYTLEGIYNRLDNGAAGAPSAFAEPAAGPTAGTGRTLNEIMAKSPAVNANAAATTEVLSGKTFWGLSLGAWGLQTGSMTNVGGQNIMPGVSVQMITQGYHDGTGAVAGDADLTAGNILSGVDIFGVTGSAVAASGSATDGQVLSGVSYSNASGASVGTMANIGAQNITPGVSVQMITQGYHDGTGAVAGDADLTAGNILSGVDIFGVTGSAVAASGSATDGQVLSGVSYSNASGASVGTMANIGTQNIMPGVSVQMITQGYHDGTGSVAGDADLVSGNIKSGADIFGVAGDPNVVDTSSGDAVQAEIAAGRKAWVDGSEITGTAVLATGTATDADVLAGVTYSSASGASVGVRPVVPVAKTGQTTSYATGDDGDLEKGEAWPNPRFTDNGDGTVTDNLTGLVWLKNANAFGTRNWATALTDCATLNDGEAGLSDGSVEGDWRLPNRYEFDSLHDLSQYNPALPAGHPFVGVQSVSYWSGTTNASSTNAAWSVVVTTGEVNRENKTYPRCVWPVRDGE